MGKKKAALILAAMDAKKVKIFAKPWRKKAKILVRERLNDQLFAEQLHY